MTPEEPIRVRTRHPHCTCEWFTDEVEWHMTALNLHCPIHQYVVNRVRDGWLYCTSPRATFVCEVEGGRVSQTAPYAYKFTMGHTVAAIRVRLKPPVWAVLFMTSEPAVTQHQHAGEQDAGGNAQTDEEPG